MSLYFCDNLGYNFISWVRGSVVERLADNEEVPSSNLGVPTILISSGL